MQNSTLIYISFKIVPLCEYALLSAAVKVLETFSETICESLFSSYVAFLTMSVASHKRRSFSADLSQENR